MTPTTLQEQALGSRREAVRLVDDVDGRVVRRFWAKKAQDEDNRWTSAALLDWEKAFVSSLLPARSIRILDLGCGHGALSRSIARLGDELTGVDQEPGFATSFEDHTFVLSEAESYETRERFDLILVFGVITYVGRDSEQAIYDVCRRLVAEGGRVILKSQCAYSKEIVVSGFSEALGTEYSGRYPSVTSVSDALSRRFASVQRVDYPVEFNAWPDTFHVAFVAGD